jgi:WD40 repeat protein
MREFKKFGIWLLILVFLIGTLPVMAAETEIAATQPAGYSDIAADNPVLPYVRYLTGLGIITGYPDGSYHPEAGLTRAEAAAVICRAANITSGSTGVSKFRDVYQDHWALAYINAAAQGSYFKGAQGEDFRPDQQITRAEALTLIFRLSGSDISQAALPPLTDMDNGHWAAKPVAAALAAGMAGLSADGSRFMPDAPFTRINMAQALALLLTEDPSLAKVALPGTLKPVTGKITLQKAGSGQEVTVTKAAGVGAGDVITSVKGAKARIDYPDGSSLLIRDDTRITIKAAEGKKYINLDGSEGIAVDWLNVDIERGTMLGALADSHRNDYTSDADQAVQPWYANVQKKKVRVQADMPWGAALIRGTFWSQLVTSGGGSSVNCLTGSVGITEGGAQVSTLGPAQVSTIVGTTAPPSPPAPMTPGMIQQQFGQEGQWLQNTAQNMDNNQGALPPLPSQPQMPGQTPQTPPAMPTPPQPGSLWQDLVQAIQNGGGTVNTGPTPPSTPVPATPSIRDRGDSDPSDLSGAAVVVDTAANPDTIAVNINNAKGTSGTLLNGVLAVTAFTVTENGETELYGAQIEFTGGSGILSIPRNVFESPGTYTIRVRIAGITNPAETNAVIPDISDAELNIVDGNIEITGARNSNGIYLSGANRVSVSMAGGTLIKEQNVVFTDDGSASLPVPGSLNIPAVYELVIEIDGINGSYPVTCDNHADWQAMAEGDIYGPGISKVALLNAGLAVQDNDGIRVWEIGQSGWGESSFVSSDDYFIEEGSLQSDGNYWAYYSRNEEEVNEIRISGGWIAPLSLPPGVDEYSLSGEGTSVAYENEGKIGLSVWAEVYGDPAYSWVSDLNGPPVGGGFDLASIPDGGNSYVACADGDQVKVYGYYDSTYQQIGQDIPVQAGSLSLDVEGVLYLACTSADGEISVWEYSNASSSWQQLGGDFSGTEAVLKTAPSGTPYLAFIDYDGTASLYKYAYLGMEDGISQYGWIGGKVHPDAESSGDVSISLNIADSGRTYLAYTEGTTVRTVYYNDPLNGVTRENVSGDLGDYLCIYGLSEDMEYSLNGSSFTQISSEDFGQVSFLLDIIDSDIGVIIRMNDSPDQAIRLLPEFIPAED